MKRDDNTMPLYFFAVRSNTVGRNRLIVLIDDDCYEPGSGTTIKIVACVPHMMQGAYACAGTLYSAHCLKAFVYHCYAFRGAKHLGSRGMK